MRSSSAITKMQTVFVITLIVVASATGGYYYVSSLIPEPASFQVADLIIDPTSVQVGESVSISVNVTNVGEEAGNHSVVLSINDVPVNTRTVQLSGSQTKTVEFVEIATTEGNHSVGVDELAGSFVSTSFEPPVEPEPPIKPAKLELANLVIIPTTVKVGEPVRISVRAANIGDEKGTFPVTLVINEIQRETKSIDLNGGAITNVEFTVTEETEGTYIVKIADLESSFEVKAEPPPPVGEAKFEVGELTINPTEARIDETIVISAEVTNVGNASGEYLLTLRINGVTRGTRNVLLGAGGSQIEQFSVTEQSEGEYTVDLDGLSGSFTVQGETPVSTTISLNNLAVAPYEVWEGDTVTIKARAHNFGNEKSSTTVSLEVKGEVKETRIVELNGGASNVPIEFEVTAGKDKSNPVRVINQVNPSNTLSGFFTVAPLGFHTLSVSASYPGMEFTLNGASHYAPYSDLLPDGFHTVVVPDGFIYSGTFFNFTSWDNGSTDLTRIVNLERKTSISALYLNTKSCPSLYYWGGSEYLYAAEVSDGTGYLGIFDSFQEDGTLVFLYSNPWDYTKLDEGRLQQKSGYYDFVLAQTWDEISFTDSVELIVVDHPADLDVFSTKATYLYDLEEQGTIYTVSKTLQKPLSCVNEEGEDLLALISELDGNYTTGNEFKWDALELNLGDLTGAEEIKLVVSGTILYSSGQAQGEWAGQFFDQPGEKPFPPPHMEVKDANGNWVPVPDNRQFPLLDVTPTTVIVNLTGLFPAQDYSLRINTFFNTRFDYIGVDTSPQEQLSIQRLTPAFADLRQRFVTDSNSTGNFTKYGDVTSLVVEPDDKLVIMRKGDEINLQFPVDLEPVPENMERSFFIAASVWFKIEGLPYLEFTVDPLPFHGMSCFPYPPTENYPTDVNHQIYLQEYNTRSISVP